MEKAFSCGKTGGSILGNTRTTRNQAMECFLGQMVGNMWEPGEMGNSMVMPYSRILRGRLSIGFSIRGRNRPGSIRISMKITNESSVS